MPEKNQTIFSNFSPVVRSDYNYFCNVIARTRDYLKEVFLAKDEHVASFCRGHTPPHPSCFSHIILNASLHVLFLFNICLWISNFRFVVQEYVAPHGWELPGTWPRSQGQKLMRRAWRLPCAIMVSSWP